MVRNNPEDKKLRGEGKRLSTHTHHVYLSLGCHTMCMYVACLSLALFLIHPDLMLNPLVIYTNNAIVAKSNISIWGYPREIT